MIASARLLAQLDRSNRASRTLSSRGRAAPQANSDVSPMQLESLEQRQMLALIGVTLTQLPLEFYNSTGVVNYDAASQSLDVSATPTSIFLPTGARVVNSTHGDFQIHARISNTGQLLGGVAGDDLIIRGATDLDGNGSIDPLTESGDLLLGEITAFGFLDSGGPTDQYDYKFVVTGGLLAPMFAGKDIGVVMTSENSNFTGDFSVNFGGKAKGTAGPVAAPLLSSIGGNVYYDQNNDGIFQNTESPIPGTKVSLTGVNDAGQLVNLFTNTLPDGSYLFTNLRPGTYELTEAQPSGYLDGKDTIGTPGGSTVNDQHFGIVLPAGYNGVQNNFGEILASSISGYVYHDVNNDGLFQGSESPIPGTSIALTGTDDLGNAVNLTTTTDINGFYIFGGLRPGAYKLNETQPAAYFDGKDTVGTPGGTTTNDQFDSIALPVGFDGVQNNFGEILASSISGYVYHDVNNDGLFQGSESPIPGTSIALTGTDDLGNAVNLTTTTDINGFYIFGGLRPGSYKLNETQPLAYLDGKDTIGTPGGTTSNDQHSGIVLPASYDGVQNNFGEILASSISGYVYHDLSNDGIFQITENPIPGTTVNLTGTDDLGNTVNLSTITNGSGFYIFGNLRPGTYQLNEVQPAAFLDGIDTIGTPGGVASNDQFASISLPANFNGVQNNFGEVLPPPQLGEIRGVKRLDITGNGMSADDTALGGVTVYIDANNNGQRDGGEASTITGPDGTYAFTGLNAGSYIIREVVPTGYVRTAPVMSDRYVVTLATGQTVTGIDFANARACDCFTVSSFQFLINGTRLVTDLRGNTNQGDEVTVIFTIPAGQSPYTFTLVSYTAPSRSFVASEASQQRIYDIDSGLFGPGTHSLTVVIPDSYYQVDFVCGFAIDTLGPAGSNIFYSAQNRLFSADNDGNNAVVAEASSISGRVYLDRDNDGQVDVNDNGLAGIKVILTGTDYLGNSVNITKYTRTDGAYTFGNLRRGSYKVSETTPDYLNDGKDTLGSLGGTKPSNDVLASIALTASTNASDYNFGELNCSGGSILGGDTANIGFWRNTQGQNLIKALNGSSNAKGLGNWLASTLPELFGADAGTANNMANKTNTQVAAYFVTKFNAADTRLEAQILATSLAIYATKSSLAGGTYAAAYGFTVSTNGLGARNFNVGSAGSLLGVSNNSTLSVLDIVKKANSKSDAGTLYSSSSTNRTKLYNLFHIMNEVGSI